MIPGSTESLMYNFNWINKWFKEILSSKGKAFSSMRRFYFFYIQNIVNGPVKNSFIMILKEFNNKFQIGSGKRIKKSKQGSI